MPLPGIHFALHQTVLLVVPVMRWVRQEEDEDQEILGLAMMAAPRHQTSFAVCIDDNGTIFPAFPDLSLHP